MSEPTGLRSLFKLTCDSLLLIQPSESGQGLLKMWHKLKQSLIVLLLLPKLPKVLFS